MSRHRVYCHAFVSATRVERNVIVAWDDDSPACAEVEPFTCETAATTALNGIILHIPDDCSLTAETARSLIDISNLAPGLDRIKSMIPPAPPTRLLMIEF